jgi:hypothetical protein
MKILIALSALLATSFGFSTQDPQDPMEMPKPGAEHKLLTRHAGDWDAVVIMAGPDGNEVREKASMSTRVVPGGFHTIDEFRGSYMGMPFTGHGTNSYCQARNKYVVSWLDSMTSSPLTLMGDYDQKANTMTLTGEALGMTGKMEPCKTVTYFKDADHYAFEMFGPGPDGDMMRMIRIEYTRKK